MKIPNRRDEGTSEGAEREIEGDGGKRKGFDASRSGRTIVSREIVRVTTNPSERIGGTGVPPHSESRRLTSWRGCMRWILRP
jgi:hypothetical protein